MRKREIHRTAWGMKVGDEGLEIRDQAGMAMDAWMRAQLVVK